MNNDFVTVVSEKFDELKNLFLQKNQQYANADPLANFRRGALLNTGKCDYAAMYEEAKSYMAKHVVHVYNHGITGNKVDESLKDIAVYCLIMLYMHEKEKAGGCCELRRDTETNI